MKRILTFLLVAMASAAVGWFARDRRPTPKTSLAGTPLGRKIAFYQSAMHPWIKSDKPGKCTICGMDLSPVYEGQSGFAPRDGVVQLGSNAMSVVGIQSAPVMRQTLVRTLRVSGTIDDDDTRHRILSAYVDGRIDRLYVTHVGAEITAGQPLAAFYSPTLLAGIREYLALQNQGAAEGSDHLRSGAALRLRQLGLTPEQIASLPNTFRPTNLTVDLVAPQGGTVTAKNVYEGQYVKEGDRLFEIADFSTMWFKANVYERDLPWLAPGQPVEVTTPSLPGSVLRAPIRFIDPNLREETRSAVVRVELPNPTTLPDGSPNPLRLKHRLFAEGRVTVELPGTLTVPRTAVLSPGSEPLVYVELGHGHFAARKVKLGRAGDTAWEVLGGLKEGEIVVTSGGLLIDGQAQIQQPMNHP